MRHVVCDSHGRKGQDGTGQKRTGQDRAGQDRTGWGRTGHKRTGQDGTGQHRVGQDRRGHDRTGQDAVLVHIFTGHDPARGSDQEVLQNSRGPSRIGSGQEVWETLTVRSGQQVSKKSRVEPGHP